MPILSSEYNPPPSINAASSFVILYLHTLEKEKIAKQDDYIYK